MNTIEKQMFPRFISEYNLNPDPTTWSADVVKTWLSALPSPDYANVLEYGTEADISELVSLYPSNVLIKGKRISVGRIMREGVVDFAELPPTDRLFFFTVF